MLLRRATSAVAVVRRSYSVKTKQSGQSDNIVKLVEVGPRDGLQNEKRPVPFETKMALIEKLSRTGLETIEAGAMVSAKWVPQMADSDRILRRLSRPVPPAGMPRAPSLYSHIKYPFLVPNLKGLERALSVSSQPVGDAGTLAAGATSSSSSALRDISVFLAATESFSHKNINCSIAESLERVKPIFALAQSHRIRVRAYVSVVVGCPYEGLGVSPAKVVELSSALLDMGAHEISLGDTTGMGTVTSVRRLLQTFRAASVPVARLAVHLHDTYGQALANSIEALSHGIRTFDASVAGLGGCPYARGATGNVATEDLIHMFRGMGLATSADARKMAHVGAWISRELGRPNESRAGKAYLASEERAQADFDKA